jgi:hypothetical protein
MSTISVTERIEAPAARVFAIATDLRNATAVLSQVQSVETLEGPDAPLAVGTRFRETRVMFGREATETMTVTDLRDFGSDRTTDSQEAS